MRKTYNNMTNVSDNNITLHFCILARHRESKLRLMLTKMVILVALIPLNLKRL